MLWIRGWGDSNDAFDFRHCHYRSYSRSRKYQTRHQREVKADLSLLLVDER